MKIVDENLRIECGNTYINSIETNSGVFTGNNTCCLWSSHSKSNSGFGSISSGRVERTLNIVIDNDAIDTIINDNDQVTFYNQDHGSPQGNLDFELENINVNALDTNSTIAIGENQQNVWSSHSKGNSGVGSVKGVSYLDNMDNYIDDRDFMDTSINDNDNVQTKRE